MTDAVKKMMYTGLITSLITACSFYSIGVKDGRQSVEQNMEAMIKSVTGYRGTVVHESAMVWRAYVLDYTGSGMTAESATYLLLKKVEVGETDSLAVID